MDARFMVVGLLTSVVNLLLHGATYALILKDFYRSHPAGSEAFVKERNRGPGELIWWAMAATSLSMGYFITMVMKWSGAKTFVAGLKRGALMGFLFWSSVNFGLYASSRVFSLASVLVDLACSGACMTLSAAFAAWALNREAARAATARP